jgi:myosin heavy subunit
LPDSSGNYFLEINSVKSSFRYFADADGFPSEYFEILVIDRPIVKTLDLEITSPSYSNIPKAVQKDNGNVQALVGSRVSLNISSTKKLSEAFLQFGDTSIIKLNVDDENASGNFSVRKDNSYQIQLIDENGNNNLAPITYQVKALYDAFPVIELLSPNQNTMLANDNRVNFLAKASDDYGFSKLLLNYRLSASRYEQPQTDFSSIEIPIDKSQLEININYIWNLTQMYLAVDDVVTYYLEIFDNDYVSGPKSARTQTLTVRVPSLDEILNDADQLQAQSETELEQVLKEADELRKTLEEIDKELKKDDPKLTWEEKQKIENALEKFQELQDKVEKINDQLGDMKQNLQENNLLSKETMEKYMELQKLMDEMTSDEMKKAMEKLQNVLKDMNRNMTQEQLQNLKMDEERFKKSIERTLNLLKRIQIEQKMDELLKRTEELTEQQENLNEQTENSNPSDQKENDNLSKKQDEITKDLEKLKKEMESLEQKMSEVPDMPMEDMEEMLEEFDQQQNQQLSEQASQDIKQNQKQKAKQNQKQLSQNMKQMKQMMQQMKDSMMQQSQMQTFTDMMKILDNIISLSKQQEDLKRESENLEPTSSMLDELAQKENNLSNNLNNLMQQMSDLSQKTFAITPEMGKSLGDAKRQMEGSVQSMKNRNGTLAGNQQGEAMKSLNEAAMMMKSSMESMMQGGSGQGGMMSLMQQLQQMSGDQMNLNNLTQKLQQMQQGGLTPQQQLEMQRLAQQQQLIQKSLEQLNQEAKVSGQSSKLPADLDNILKKMQEVVTDMQGEKLDDELIQKQENILSKLSGCAEINQRERL